MDTKKKKKSFKATRTKGKRSSASSRPARRKSSRKKKPEAAVLPVLNAEKLKELYVAMVKCRMLAERVRMLQTSAHQLEPPFAGLEATLVGAGVHLLTNDCIALEHSSFVASLIKGTPLPLILARARDHQSKYAGFFSASQDTSASTLTMGSVVALAEEMKGKGAVTLMFCTHDGRTLLFEPESMAHAATLKLPMVCLLESSFDSRVEAYGQSASGPYVGADPAFYPVIPVDGCDVVAVFRVAQEAIRRAREGHGPAVIECITARAAAAPAKHAEKVKPEQYIAQDPLSFMEQYLRRRELWSEQWSHSVIAAFSRELDQAVASLNYPAEPGVHFDNVYSTDGQSARPAAAVPRQTAIPTA
jgi:TPP-dependent pyruvate/acetoin dehydrogenase alpha subunit